MASANKSIEEIKVQYISDFVAISGYGNAARSSLRAMLAANMNVTLGLNSHDTNKPVLDDYWSEDDKLVKMIDAGLESTETPDVRIWCQTPNWFTGLDLDDGAYNIGWTLWETSKIIDFNLFGTRENNWVHQLNKCDEVWTSCEFSKQVFIDSGVTKPIYVVGHPRDWDKYKKAETSSGFKLGPLEDDSFKFLAVSQWTPRKGFDELILAYLTEFTVEDNTNLIVKTYRDSFEDAKAIINDINRLKASLRRDGKKLPNISLLFENVPEEDMPLLYNMSDCFVLTTRGEGFGMPLVEAMGSELLCVTPTHTAMKDYVNPGVNCIGIDDWYEDTISGMPQMPVYQSDQYWYKCSGKGIREALRKAYNMSQEDKEKYGREARKTVTSQYSFEQLGKEMSEHILRAVNSNSNPVETSSEAKS